jgi:hypothetical protein
MNYKAKWTQAGIGVGFMTFGFLMVVFYFTCGDATREKYGTNLLILGSIFFVIGLR